MNNYISYFISILPYEVLAAYTGLSEKNNYFYISSTQHSPTQLTHYYILSSDILIKADTGSKYYGTFINHIEVYKRENKCWKLLSEKFYSSLKFSLEILKSKSSALLKEVLMKKVAEGNSIFINDMDDYVNFTIEKAFSNQYLNLASLYFKEI